MTNLLLYVLCPIMTHQNEIETKWMLTLGTRKWKFTLLGRKITKLGPENLIHTEHMEVRGTQGSGE